MDCLSENYQLKWHSFGAYLHSSVAASICGGNDSSSFTDVVLLTIDGHQFLAHRFILSACSQYLNEILKSHSKMNTTLPLLIVLPPEISYKTLRILIQYMYSGEATVSKDILENVLRGGDLLKVKGLWRPREEENQNEKKIIKLHSGGKQRNVKHTDKRVHHRLGEHKQQQNQNSLLSQQQQQQEQQQSQGEQIKNHHQQVSVLKSTRIEEANAQAIINRKRKENENEEKKQQNRRDVSEDRDNLSSARSYCGGDVGGSTFSSEASTSSVSGHDMQQQECEELNTNVAEQMLIIKEEPIDWIDNEDEIDGCGNIDGQITIKAEVLLDDKDKEDDDEDEFNNGESKDEIYSPLTCELCSETFTQPAEWVRHIQTHTDMMPAKRQRRGKSLSDEDPVSGGNFPPLHCDMCQEYYPTPAEWVHHIQNTHTEFELRLSNKNNTSPKARIPPPPPLVKAINNKTSQSTHGHTPKICTVCNKKFPSHASMLIHKRTHTGERPYTCKFCSKGFNVKSNLLRHLRTLHDKIINSAEVDFREDNNSNNSTTDNV